MGDRGTGYVLLGDKGKRGLIVSTYFNFAVVSNMWSWKGKSFCIGSGRGCGTVEKEIHGLKDDLVCLVSGSYSRRLTSMEKYSIKSELAGG